MAVDRFTEIERWGLYWVAWWMDELQRAGKLGGTLTEANRILREMIGPLPGGYSYDPDDEADSRHLTAGDAGGAGGEE